MALSVEWGKCLVLILPAATENNIITEILIPCYGSCQA